MTGVSMLTASNEGTRSCSLPGYISPVKRLKGGLK